MQPGLKDFFVALPIVEYVIREGFQWSGGSMNLKPLLTTNNSKKEVSKD